MCILRNSAYLDFFLECYLIRTKLYVCSLSPNSLNIVFVRPIKVAVCNYNLISCIPGEYFHMWTHNVYNHVKKHHTCLNHEEIMMAKWNCRLCPCKSWKQVRGSSASASPTSVASDSCFGQSDVYIHSGHSLWVHFVDYKQGQTFSHMFIHYLVFFTKVQFYSFLIFLSILRHYIYFEYQLSVFQISPSTLNYLFTHHSGFVL